jgi:superfamily II DNA or RNA helicase
VGGMKQSALQETETKHIVLATYAMAAEALDIKTLNTLVMVSPKTDIVQSVGRILRTSGEGKIIVDIIDPHDVFQNQWKKRKTFYNKSDYQIRMVKKEYYPGMDIDWDTDPNWQLLAYRKRASNRKKPETDIQTNDDNDDNNDDNNDADETKPIKPRTCFISTSNIVW